VTKFTVREVSEVVEATFMVIFSFAILGAVVFLCSRIAGGFGELLRLIRSGLSDFKKDPLGTLKAVVRFYKDGAIKLFDTLRQRGELFYLRQRYGETRVYGFRSDDPRINEYRVGGSTLYCDRPGRPNGRNKSAKILSFDFDCHGLARVQLQNAAGDVFTRMASDLRPARN